MELFKIENAFDLRRDIEDAIERIGPEFNNEGTFTKFAGWAKMATPLTKFTLHYIAPAFLGERVPSKVLAEVEYSVASMPTYLKREWEELQPHDIVFLVSLHGDKQTSHVKLIRGGEVISHLDEKNKRMSKKSPAEGKLRRLQLLLDPYQYKIDLQLETKSQKIAEIYGDFHLLIRRNAKKNIFKPVLQTLNNMRKNQNQLGISEKLKELVLGYGDPSDSTLHDDENQKQGEIDLFDLFLDAQHYEDCFTNNPLLSEQQKERTTWSTRSFPYQQTRRNCLRFTQQQASGIISGLHQELTLILGPPGTGKTDTAVQLLTLLLYNYPQEKILLLTHSNKALDDLVEKLENAGVADRVVRLGKGAVNEEFGRQGRVNRVLIRRLQLLEEVKKIQNLVGGKMAEEVTCETAALFFKVVLTKKWQQWRNTVKLEQSITGYQIIETCPLANYFLIAEGVFPFENKVRTLDNNYNNNNKQNVFNQIFEDIDNHSQVLEKLDYYWRVLCRNIFEELEDMHAFEILRGNKERQNYIITQYSRIIAMTCTYATMRRDYFQEIGLTYDSIVCEEAAQILEIETFTSFTLQKSHAKEKSKLKRIVLIGDENQLPPIIKHAWFQKQANMELTFFKRLLRLGFQRFMLEHQGRARESILSLYQWKYPSLKSINNHNNAFPLKNPGFCYDFQFIEVGQFQGKGEISPSKHFYQNLSEAEFIVATYMFMILTGYEPQKITILTTYNGQKSLIKDIMKAKCSWNSEFGKPKAITTVDKYQGQQNDYILLSLVRTKHIGHLKDPRRLIVAVSRARLGLYVFGRFDIFANYNEIKQTFDVFKQRPRQLHLQKKGDENEILKPSNFQELYKIVLEMINEQKNSQ